MIVMAFRPPTVERMVGDPLPPQPLSRHSAINTGHRGNHARAKEWEIDQYLGQHGARILLLERVEDIAIPDVDAVLNEQLDE